MHRASDDRRAHLIELTFLETLWLRLRRQRESGGRLQLKPRQSELRYRMDYVDATPPSENVDECVLQQRGEHEHETHRHPDVDRLHVRDARQRRVDERRLGRCRQNGQQADGHACRTGIDVEPERHPRQDDDQHTGNVELNNEVADVSDQHEPNLEARECTYTSTNTHSHLVISHEV